MFDLTRDLRHAARRLTRTPMSGCRSRASAAAAVASYLPARRVTRIHPVEALRAE